MLPYPIEEVDSEVSAEGHPSCQQVDLWLHLPTQALESSWSNGGQTS